MGTEERTSKAKDTHYNDSPIFPSKKLPRNIQAQTSIQLKISRIQLDTLRGNTETNTVT